MIQNELLKINKVKFLVPLLTDNDLIVFRKNFLAANNDDHVSSQELNLLFIFEWLIHVGLDRNCCKFIIKHILQNYKEFLGNPNVPFQIIIADHRYVTFTNSNSWYDLILEQEHNGPVICPVSYYICNVNNLFLRKLGKKHDE
jgi:hypothetical protein